MTSLETRDLWPLVGRSSRAGRSTVFVGGVPFGPRQVTLIAGPPIVESESLTLAAAMIARQAGARVFRAGLHPPAASPSLSALRSALKILSRVRAETGLAVIADVRDLAGVSMAADYADMVEVRPNSMTDLTLLAAVARGGLPVLLVRGAQATLKEWVTAAEYVATKGNLSVVLCEAGIRTFERSTKTTLDVSAVPILQQLTHLPVVVDPSSACGRRDIVGPLARASVAAGADGLIVECHPSPETAYAGERAVREQRMIELGAELRAVATAVRDEGRRADSRCAR